MSASITGGEKKTKTWISTTVYMNSWVLTACSTHWLFQLETKPDLNIVQVGQSICVTLFCKLKGIFSIFSDFDRFLNLVHYLTSFTFTAEARL